MIGGIVRRRYSIRGAERIGEETKSEVSTGSMETCSGVIVGDGVWSANQSSLDFYKDREFLSV